MCGCSLLGNREVSRSVNDAKRCWSAAGRRGAVDGRLGDQLWFGLVSTGASDSVSTGVRDGAMARVEVITGRERRRRWSAEQKRALAVESFASGAVVTEIARRADIGAGQ